MAWKYLNFFLEDDERLARIGAEYGAGRMLTGEIKAELIQARLGCTDMFDPCIVPASEASCLCLMPLHLMLYIKAMPCGPHDSEAPHDCAAGSCPALHPVARLRRALHEHTFQELVASDDEFR